MIISFKKILLTLLPIICFSSAFADKPLVEDILQSGALPTGSATLALIDDKNGESVTQSVLQGNSFWNNNTGINWDPSTTATDTVGNPWLKFDPAIPVHRKGQEGYTSFYDTTITVDSTDDYKKITGLYGYKITINLTNDLNFGGETLPPLFNIVAFIGNYHTISNFKIKCDGDYAGLLSTVSDSVCDLTLKFNGFQTAGVPSYKGVLVGRLLPGGKIKNCHVINNTTNEVQVWGTSYLGGLVGYSEGTIEGCSVSRIDVRAMGNHAGGLVGYAKGKISNCSVDTAKVEAKEKCVGGLVGYTNSEIEGCSVTKPTVSSFSGTTSSCYAGGLVGLIEGVSDVKNCTVKNATVSGYTMVGGLIGYKGESGNPIITGTIQNCSVETVTITIAKDYAGGLVGRDIDTSGSITSCTAKKVTISSTASGSFAGGLAGMFNGAITDCNVSEVDIKGIYASGGGLVGQGSISSIANCTTNTVSISLANDCAGGLVGNNTSSSTTGLITSCTARNVTIKSSGGSYVGGLTGKSLISISNCQASKIYIQGIYGNGGGLVGELIGAVANCKVDTVSVAGGTKIGGLVGNNLNPTGTITNCAVDSVAVTATATGSPVGGLIGFNKATIDGCSANRVVVKGSSSGDSYAGGLVGQSNDKDVKNSKVTNGTISGYGLLGGLVGHTLSGNLYNDTVSNVIVTASSGSQAGGLTSYLAPYSIVEYCEVKNITISGQEKIAGLVGLSSGAKIANSKVMGGTVSGTSYIGGLVGYGDNASTSTTRCAVNAVNVTASGDNVGGLIGYNLGNISDCSVSRVPLSAHTYLGGIVGYSKGLVLRCLVTGTTITSSNTNADNGFVGGVVGYNFGGWVKNCVAMIKYFDIKARYTKNGEKFGRIVSNNGNLSNNYGWVETAIRYWHWRFGINWGTDYYKGTGQTYQDYRNGENLFIGDKHYSTDVKMAKESSFWTNIGFTSNNGWETGSVGTKFYPQLTIVQDDDLGSIGTARGFEYELKLITDNAGNYQGKTVNIFTPQFFSNYVNGSYCAYFGNSSCNLYTDIELATEDNSGNTVFWSTDLNGGLSHNFSYSAIRLHDNQAGYFDGKGYSIIGLHKEYTGSLASIDNTSGGFFHAPYSNLTIKRLQLDSPVGYIDCGFNTQNFLRYGFLVCQADWEITLEDIYVKKPQLKTLSGYPINYGKIVFDFNINGVAGTLIGRANYIKGSNVVAYFPSGSYMHGTVTEGAHQYSYTHYGCLFGAVTGTIELNRVAVSLGNSKDMLYSQSYRSWTEEGGWTEDNVSGSETRPFLKGFIAGFNKNTTLTLNSASFHDGYNGTMANFAYNDFFPNNSVAYPVPKILQLGIVLDGFGYYPNAGTFYNTLVNSGIRNQPNWFIPESYTDDGVHLKRDEYSW